MKKAYILVLFAILFSLCIPVISEAFPRAGYSDSGTVTGEVTIKGVGPILGGTVFFIDEAAGVPPSPARYWVVPTYIFPLDDASRFSVRLPEGTYYMGVLERKASKILGPPEEGDYFFIAQDSKGNPKKLTVWSNSSINLGTIQGAAPFRNSSLESKKITAIEGVLRDIHGNAIGGLSVAAYADREMSGRPLFISQKTGIDGKFTLRVNKGGTYYLMARAEHEDVIPGPEELIGFTKKGKPAKVRSGALLKGLEIVVCPAKMYGE